MWGIFLSFQIPIQELGNDFLNSLDILPLEQGRRSSLVKVHNASFENLSGGKKTDLKVPISTPLACDSQTLFQVPRTCTSKLCKKITCHNLLYSPFGYPVFDQARKWMENQKQLFASDSDLRPQFKNCSHFKQSHGYHLTAGTQEEAEFPIAFNIIMHKDFNQVERLLRAIYRPQNVYCIHVDGKSPQSLIEATRELAGCFSNVFVASKLEKVVYAGFSRLQADINCMEDLVSSSRPWRYLLNLAGQAFPLKTNAELVRILKIYNGSNDIEGIFGKRIIRTRFEKVWREKDSKMETVDGKRNPPPPDDIDIVRGSAYGVFSREFVEFILTDNKAKRLLEWSRTTYSPDEHFWATLHHTYVNPHVKAPGSYAGKRLGRWLTPPIPAFQVVGHKIAFWVARGWRRVFFPTQAPPYSKLLKICFVRRIYW